MFFKYFYFLDVCSKLNSWLLYSSIAVCVFILMLFGSMVDSEEDIVKKSMSMIKKLLVLIVVLMGLRIFIPTENAIKALVFDKVVVENKSEIIDMTKNSIDYIINKIKEVKK